MLIKYILPKGEKISMYDTSNHLFFFNSFLKIMYMYCIYHPGLSGSKVNRIGSSSKLHVNSKN